MKLLNINNVNILTNSIKTSKTVHIKKRKLKKSKKLVRREEKNLCAK